MIQFFLNTSAVSGWLTNLFVYSLYIIESIIIFLFTKEHGDRGQWEYLRVDQGIQGGGVEDQASKEVLHQGDKQQNLSKKRTRVKKKKNLWEENLLAGFCQCCLISSNFLVPYKLSWWLGANLSRKINKHSLSKYITPIKKKQ